MSMTPSSVSPPLLGRFIFSVRPSSLSLRRLSRSVVSLAPSSFSLGLLSRSRVFTSDWNVVTSDHSYGIVYIGSNMIHES
ncbi:hypothetical protein F2Q70_00043535 [Brassica cretica]|uniref:Uncharacterized protein n=1 Tax=Brassica cretica TaxID=69181 RepID=A0A8S9KJM1_BRACR|nr:hypothetical protein F2Q70_00043535 [Brassica cretica]